MIKNKHITLRTVGRLDLELLSAFVAIVECGGFSRAASRLNRTQSAVSMQIKRLEERVGRRLLNRSAHGVSLTEEGRVLFDYAEKILDLNEQARMHFAAPELEGNVRLGLPEWFAGKRLQNLLARFSRAHPRVRLSVRVGPSSDLRDFLQLGTLDLALAIAETPDVPRAVYREPLCWVVGRDVTPNVHDEMPLALFDPPCPYREITKQRLGKAGWQWRETFTSSSVASVRVAVEAGLGISVFPQSAVTSDLAVLGPRDGFPTLPETELAIYTAPRLASTPALHLREYLEEIVQDPGDVAAGG